MVDWLGGLLFCGFISWVFFGGLITCMDGWMPGSEAGWLDDWSVEYLVD
jgi:hypothetical protein